MTWSAVVANGRGELSYRLKIERLSTEFVTHVSQETATRKPWLKLNGKLKCMSNPVSGEVEVSGLQAIIVDKDRQATAIFAVQPSYTTWLTSQLDYNDVTDMDVRSTAGWPSSGSLWIDSEVITYSGIGSSTTFTGLTRGALGSLAQSHYVSTYGAARFPEITSSPASIAGCRARLYAYGADDDPQGDGTQIWLGVVTRHPSLMGGQWTIGIDPITSVLSKSISADMQEPATARGIKYDWSNGVGLVFRRTDTGEVLGTRFPQRLPTPDLAFFEDNDSFTAALTARIAYFVTTAGWDTAFSCSIRAIASGPDFWFLGVTTDGTSGVEVVSSSGPIDPVFIGEPTDIDGNNVGLSSGVERYWLPQPSSLPGAGSVPRGYLGTSSVGVGGDTSAADVFPINRLYVSGAAIDSTTDTVAIEWQELGSSPKAETIPTILTTESATNSVKLDADAFAPGFAGSLLTGYYWTASSAPKIRFGRTYAAESHIYSALFRIITLAPTLVNVGGVPDLRIGDLDTTAWASIDTGTEPRIVAGRKFTSFTDVELLDLVKNELLLAGYMLGVNGSGQIAIAPIRGISRTELPDIVLDAFLDFPSWEPTAYGLVNQVSIQRGYSALEDDYTTNRVLVRDVAEFSRNPRPRTISIEPKSAPAGAVESYGECVEVAQRIFSAFAGPYAIITAKVPLTAYTDGTIGAVASVTSPHIPDFETGTMGVTGLRAIITGREIDLRNGEITLRMYATQLSTAGYAPSGLITAESNVSGNTWDVTISADYMPSGSTTADWFFAGDLVSANRWDTTTDTKITGTVVSANASNVVRVAFDASAAALSSQDFYLTTRPATAALTTQQKRFGFIGDSAMMVSFVSGDLPARRFS